jgi:predicted nucleotide-binding protein
VDETVKQHASDLFDQAHHAALAARLDKIRFLKHEMAQRNFGSVFSGMEYGRQMTIEAEFIGRLMTARLTAFREAFEKAGIQPSREDLQEIWRQIEETQENTTRQSANHLSGYLKQGGPDIGDPKQALAAVVAHDHDQVLHDFKVWRSGNALKLLNVSGAKDESPEHKNAGAQELQSPVDPQKIFVVHGRDEQLRKDLFEFLRALGLTPLDWSEAVRLTGKGSPYIGEILDAAFAHAQAIVVLLTPDDEVRLSSELVRSNDGPAEQEYQLQARPNVLFEAGLGFGRNPDRTILVEVGSPKPFSDVAGRHTVRLSNDESRRQDLMDRLKTAGCKVQPPDERWRTVGKFEVSRTVPAATSGKAILLTAAVETEPSVKWVDILYPLNSGLQEQLKAEGYTVRWSLDTDLARRLDINGWTLVTQSSGSGREVILKMKDRPADQTLIKKKVGDAKPAPAPKHNIRFIEAKSLHAHAGINDSQIHESPQPPGDFQVAVVCFRNDPLIGQSLQQPSLKSHIVYKEKNGTEITDAFPGVWLGHYGEAADFESGKKQCLIVFLLTKQKKLMKLWNETYTTHTSWMVGGPLFRIRDEAVPGNVASINISLLSDNTCMLSVEFEVKPHTAGELPKLVLLGP